jgi:hypothetical protein
MSGESNLNETVEAAQNLLHAVAPNGRGNGDDGATTANAATRSAASPTGDAPARREGKTRKKTTKKRSRTRVTTGGKARPNGAATPARRSPRLFPASTFEEALELPWAIQKISGGEKVRRLTLFEQLDKSPESGPSRQMITNASRYGLITGSYKAEWLELTASGRKATSNEVSERERLQAQFELAIARIEPFKLLYDALRDRRVPTHAVMRDLLADAGYASDQLQECVNTFIVNAKFLGLLRAIAGSERLTSIEQLIDERPAGIPSSAASPAADDASGDSTSDVEDWSRICFYVTPIGDTDSETRQHSDLILASLVEPALAEIGLTVIRADRIDKPGVITKQIIEHVAKARLVIADLSFHNPNVFYELALRHTTGKPTIHLIRTGERIPFDIGQFRTIHIDTSGLYAFVPQIETYRAEIATHARRALDEEGTAAGPLAIFYPDLNSHLREAA